MLLNMFACACIHMNGRHACIRQIIIVVHLEVKHSCAMAAGNMAPKFRRALAEKLAQHAPMFGLSEVAFPSFELQNGWNRVTRFSTPCAPIHPRSRAVRFLAECSHLLLCLRLIMTY